MINRIESIPIVLDKNFMEMKKEKRKERPQTSKLKAKFNFESKDDSKYAKKKNTARVDKRIPVTFFQVKLKLLSTKYDIKVITIYLVSLNN